MVFEDGVMNYNNIMKMKMLLQMMMMMVFKEVLIEFICPTSRPIDARPRTNMIFTAVDMCSEIN